MYASINKNNTVAQKCSTDAPDVCVLEATDADEHADNLRDWQQQYDQVSHGPFHGKIEELSSQHLHVFREHTSQSVRQQCNVWSNSVWLGVAANGQSCRINGQQVNHQQLMVRPGDTQFELVTPEQFDIYGIVINLDALSDAAEEDDSEFDKTIQSSLIKEWHPEKLARMKSTLNGWLAPNEQQSVDSFQQDNLMTAVLDILNYADPVTAKMPSFKRRLAVVNTVKDYLEAHSARTITISELCELCHVSRRTLQYSFEDVLGMSPLKYIRLSRLNGVRRHLLMGLEDGETIAMVAERWGFLHAGQFSHDYTELFAENPSITLLRQRY